MNAVKSVFNKLTILSIRGKAFHSPASSHTQMNSDYFLILDDLPCLYGQPYPPWSLLLYLVFLDIHGVEV